MPKPRLTHLTRIERERHESRLADVKDEGFDFEDPG